MNPINTDESNSSDSNFPKFFYVTETHFIVMSLITLGLFNTYWMYKNWSFIKKRDDLDIQPIWRAIFGIFYIHSLLNEITKNKETDLKNHTILSASMLATGWIAMNLFGNIIGRSEDLSTGTIGLVISLSSFLFLLPIQKYIFQLNYEINNNVPFTKWTFGQSLCLILGTPVFLLVLTGLLSN